MAERMGLRRTSVPDEDLLSELAQLFRSSVPNPPADRVADFRRVVAERGMPAEEGAAVGRLLASGRSLVRWRKPLAGLGVMVAALAGGTSAAFATGAAPEPLRAIAYDVGLPVDSPALSAARHDLARLRSFLDQGLSSAALAARTASAADELARQLGQLSSGDARRLGPLPYQLIARAEALEASYNHPAAGAASRPAAAPPAGSAPSQPRAGQPRYPGGSGAYPSGPTAAAGPYAGFSSGNRWPPPATSSPTYRSGGSYGPAPYPRTGYSYPTGGYSGYGTTPYSSQPSPSYSGYGGYGGSGGSYPYHTYSGGPYPGGTYGSYGRYGYRY